MRTAGFTLPDPKSPGRCDAERACDGGGGVFKSEVWAGTRSHSADARATTEVMGLRNLLCSRNEC